MAIIKYAFCLYSFFCITLSLAAQDLDKNVFMIQSNGTKAKGKVIEADYSYLGKNGAKVHLWDKQGTPHQTWKFEPLAAGENLYHIINQSPKAGKHKYLEVGWTALGQDGRRIQLWEFNGGQNGRYGANQIWQVIKNKEGTYSIISAHPKSSGKALESDSFTQQNNGGKVQLYFNTDSQNQTWNLVILK